MDKFLKDFWFPLLIIVVISVLLATEELYKMTPGIQLLAKKTLLASYFYVLTYLFRVFRLGTIKWDEKDKKYYYFVLLICLSIIFALG